MRLPFTVEQFYAVFREYNTAVWPAQALLLGFAAIAVVLVLARHPRSGIGISAILALLWIWMGLAYHLAFFTSISAPAFAFAVLSVAGGVVFFWQGVVRRMLEFSWAAGVRSIIGVVLIVFVLVVYPAWSYTAGHHYPATPTFGLPCPTTIFTIGLLAFLVRPYPRGPIVVPILWSFVGGQAAFLLAVPPDLGLVVAGVFGIVLFARSRAPTLRVPSSTRQALA